MTKPNLPGEGTLDELLTYLPEGWDELAYELSAIIRERKVKSPTDLVRMVMRYSGLDSSLRESAGYFTLWHRGGSRTRPYGSGCWFACCPAWGRPPSGCGQHLASGAGDGWRGLPCALGAGAGGLAPA